jgi:hypothetical protein
VESPNWKRRGFGAIGYSLSWITAFRGLQPLVDYCVAHALIARGVHNRVNALGSHNDEMPVGERRFDPYSRFISAHFRDRRPQVSASH